MEWALGILAFLGIVYAVATPGNQIPDLTDCAIEAARFRQQIELNGQLSPEEVGAFRQFTQRCQLIEGHAPDGETAPTIPTAPTATP